MSADRLKAELRTAGPAGVSTFYLAGTGRSFGPGHRSQMNHREYEMIWLLCLWRSRDDEPVRCRLVWSALRSTGPV